METMRDLRVRMKSIRSTKQITESMRLISTRKVQSAKQRMGENRPFLTHSINAVKSMANNSQLSQNRFIAGNGESKSLVIMITGDRGLCGGYNVNVQKETFALVRKLKDVQMIAIGAKGKDYCRRRRRPAIHSFTGLSENPFYEEAQAISTIALKMYNDKSVGQIYLVFSEYHSMLSQIPKAVRLLPLDMESGGDELSSVTNYEPGIEPLFDYAVSNYVNSMLYGAMLESTVSEQSARVASMDSAAKNSDKIIDLLTLQYNQMRQGSITQEIAEIVGGANAVEIE